MTEKTEFSCQKSHGTERCLFAEIGVRLLGDAGRISDTRKEGMNKLMVL